MIVLDANVLIAHLEAANVHHQRATGLLLAAADEELGISPLTLAEVLVGPARSGQLDAAREAISRLGITTVGLDAEAPARLAMVRSSTGLRMPDCCVLLAAESAGAELATFDHQLGAKAEGRGVVTRTG